MRSGLRGADLPAASSPAPPSAQVGLGICYDMRFPELSAAMRAAGAELLVFPGAFNMTTGPMHWELLQRARALDNQLYVVACSPARNPDAGYVRARPGRPLCRARYC